MTKEVGRFLVGVIGQKSGLSREMQVDAKEVKANPPKSAPT
jgi:hypothetical protein